MVAVLICVFALLLSFACVSQVPTTADQHLDLQCWMIVASRLLADMSATLGQSPAYYRKVATQLMRRLEVHWDERRGIFCDIGAVRCAVASCCNAVAS